MYVGNEPWQRKMKGQDVTRIIPRSALGAAIAVGYLLLVFFLMVLIVTGDKGLHSGTAMLALFVIALTLPLSWVGSEIVDSVKPSQSYDGTDYLFVALMGVSALINAGVIYLLVGFAIRGLRSLARKRFK